MFLGPRLLTSASILLLLLLVSFCCSVHHSSRILPAKDVRCSCRKEPRKDLFVKFHNDLDCTNLRHRQSGRVEAEGLRDYPLQAKLHRGHHPTNNSSRSSSIIITWNLQYLSKKKRSQIKDFLLWFSKAASGGVGRSACFSVTGLDQNCTNKVDCTAVYHKRRPRRLSVKLLYKFTLKRARPKSKETKTKFHSLEISLIRKGQRKGGVANSSSQSPRKRRIDKTCSQWRPAILMNASRNGQLQVDYSPPNRGTDRMEIALHNGQDHHQLRRTFVSGNVTSYTFVGLAGGSYSVTIRPHGSQCHNVDYIWSSPVTVQDACTQAPGPVCSDWRPTVSAEIKWREDRQGKSLIQVNYCIPVNFQALQVEVALEENDTLVATNFFSVTQTSVLLNVTTNVNNNYFALVRPVGCRDCKNYNLHRELCILSYSKSRNIVIPSPAEQPLKPDMESGVQQNNVTLALSDSRESLARNSWTSGMTTTPNIKMTSPGTETTLASVRSSIEQKEINLSHLIWLTMASSALIVVVVVAVVMWFLRQGNGCRKTPLNNSFDEDFENPAERQFLPATGETEQLSDSVPPELPTRLYSEPDIALRQHDQQHLTAHKRSSWLENEARRPVCMPGISQRDIRVFLVHEAENEGLKEILSHFANVMRCDLSPAFRVTVQLDFECDSDSCNNVRNWTEVNMRTCNIIIVVLSEDFLSICRSYRASKRQELESPSAYRDIGPIVLEHLTSNGQMRVALFVHFGLRNAERHLDQLLQLYSDPPRHFLPRQLSPQISSHGATFSAVSPCDADSCCACSHGHENGLQTGNCPSEDRWPPDNCRLPEIAGTAVQETAGHDAAAHHIAQSGSLAFSSTNFGSRDMIQSFRQRHLSAPQPSSDRHFKHSHGSPPPFYHQILPHLSSAYSSSQTAEEYLPFSNQICRDPVLCQAPDHSVYNGLPAHFYRSLPNNPAPAVQRHHRVRRLCAGQQPKLISLRNTQGLRDFFAILCQDEGTVDNALAGQNARLLSEAIEKRCNTGGMN